MLDQDRLDLGRVDVLAARDDEVVAPVQHGEEPVRVDGARVPRVEAPVADDRRRVVRPAVVPGEHHRPADDDLPHLVRSRSPAVDLHAQVDAGEGAPGGPGP
jgi:hypothetical protein